MFKLMRLTCWGLSTAAFMSLNAAPIILIANGDFSLGLSSWSVEGTGGVIVKDGYMEAWRTAPQGKAGVIQSLNLDLSGYASLYLALDVRAVDQTLIAPGWYGVEYPVEVWFNYIDTTGVARTFARGFYYDGSGDSSAMPGIAVEQNTWYRYTSPDLLQLTQKPKTVTSVEVLGAGWIYTGDADNVQLLADSGVPEPGTLALMTLGLAALAFTARRIRA